MSGPVASGPGSPPRMPEPSSQLLQVAMSLGSVTKGRGRPHSDSSRASGFSGSCNRAATWARWLRWWAHSEWVPGVGSRGGHSGQHHPPFLSGSRPLGKEASKACSAANTSDDLFWAFVPWNEMVSKEVFASYQYYHVNGPFMEAHRGPSPGRRNTMQL